VRRTPDGLAAFFFPLFERTGKKEQNWDGVALCSVVPPANTAVTQFCRSYLGQDPFQIHGKLDLGFELNVDVPSEVGADRLANAAYAINRLELAAIIVDFGTAITFDVISKEGAYEGGVIIPGVGAAFESLSKKTSQLPLVPLEFPKTVIGKNTTTCIQGGILLGYCELISGLLKRTSAEMGEIKDVVLTGGFSELFQPYLTIKSKVHPNLTLEGVELLFHQIKSNS